MKTFQAVIFDLDNTLYPYHQYFTSGYKAVSEYLSRIYGISVSKRAGPEILPHQDEESFAILLAEHFTSVEESFLQKLLKVYYSHSPDINLYSDAMICLSMLRMKNIRIGLSIPGHPPTQKNKVEALNVKPLVDSIIYASDLLGDNTFTEALLLSELESEIPLSSTLYVGNIGRAELVSARRLGLHTARVERSARSHMHNDKTKPDITISSLKQIQELV